MTIEEFRAAFHGLGMEIYDGIPVRDVFIGIGNCMTAMQCRIVEMEAHNNKMQILNVERMSKLERRIIDLAVHCQSLEERLRDYLETALAREDAANQRADKAEKRRLPHWSDMPRA